MKDLAITLRSAQLVAHNMHNLVKGLTFFEDHEFFGGLYSDYEGMYDDVVERLIGLGEMPDLVEINKQACAKATAVDVAGMNADAMFSAILSIESTIQSQSSSYGKSASFGTNNMLADIADKSEKRCYKIKQRSKSASSSASRSMATLLNERF